MIINKVGNQVHLLQTWYSHINQGRFFSSFPLNRADCTQEDPKENQIAKLSPNSSIVFAWLNNLILWTELTLLSSSRQWSQSNMGRENTQLGPQFVIRCGPALVGPLCCGSEEWGEGVETVLITSLYLRLGSLYTSQSIKIFHTCNAALVIIH